MREQAHSSAYLLVQGKKPLRRRPRVSDISPAQWQKRTDTKRRVARVHLRRHVDTRTHPRVASGLYPAWAKIHCTSWHIDHLNLKPGCTHTAARDVVHLAIGIGVAFTRVYVLPTAVPRNWNAIARRGDFYPGMWGYRSYDNLSLSPARSSKDRADSGEGVN